MRSRYGDSSPTYRPYRSSPPFEGVGETSMSSPRIPSSPQVYLPEAQPRVYDIAQLSSSIREEEKAPIAKSETYRLLFLAPEILDILYYKYFDGVRMRGVKDPEFLERITPTFICLISTAIWHGIRVRSMGTYVKPDHFQSQNENVVSKHPRSLTAITRALRAVKDALETTECFESETFNRMSNTWKGRSRQSQEATLEVIKDNLWEKIQEKKGITIEVIPEDGFSEDDEALAADLTAFQNARKAPPNALVDPSGSDNGGGQEEVVHAQLRGIEAEEEGEENEEEQEEGDHEGGEEEEDV
ncbi:hypothetical protein DFP73DRAFT_596310 [Morchella snyderi]|nr:hypothetical protein DFP73DRAFT_596310 [Morchella snyderi]